MLTEKRTLLLGSLMALVCAGIISGAVALEMRSKTSAATVDATNSDANVITIPEQTPLKITLDQGISSNVSRPGDHFQATLAEPVVLNDRVVVPQGTPVDGVVVDAVPSGHLRGRAQLQLALDSMQVDGKTYDLSTRKNYRGRSHKKHNWAWIGGGAGGGAVIGALAAGGKGALIGGPIGAGAGVAVAYFTGKRDIHLSPETHLQFRLSQPLTIDAKS